MSAIPQLNTQTTETLSRPFQLLINGAWCDAQTGEILDVVNPADGKVIAKIPAGGKADIDRAVVAARAAFEHGPWSSMTPGARAKLLWRIADLIEANAIELSELETLDNGKPITMSRAQDIPAAASAFRYWAGACTKISGRTPSVDLPGEFLAMTLREPVGVVGLITPWNYPLLTVSSKLGPALAAGCTVVVKPAEQTSLTALRLGALFLEAGFPPGVINIITGLGVAAGAALAEHMDVDKISFTGSTQIGKSLVGASRGNLKRLTLELGGKSPTIIFADADLERAIPAAANGIFRNAGQVCVAGSRLFVARSRFDEVLEGVVEAASKYRLGPGLDPDTTMGPLVSAVQHRRVLNYMDSARKEGASIITGGVARGDAGYFVEPTVITETKPDMRVVREEIFGPVLVAEAVDDIDQLAAMANDTIYGLSASIWTQNISHAYRLAKRIKAGTVTINAGSISGPSLPFGGYKQSGWGRENGEQGIENFTELKTVVTALA